MKDLIKKRGESMFSWCKVRYLLCNNTKLISNVNYSAYVKFLNILFKVKRLAQYTTKYGASSPCNELITLNTTGA